MNSYEQSGTVSSAGPAKSAKLETVAISTALPLKTASRQLYTALIIRFKMHQSTELQHNRAMIY